MSRAPWFWASTIDLVGNHLWQSTVFAAVVWLLTLALRNNRAQVRYGLWLCASVKFLLPFAAMVTLVDRFAWRSPLPSAQPQLAFVMDAVIQPFSQPKIHDAGLPAAASLGVGVLPLALLAIWLCGGAAMLLAWAVRWRRVAASVRKGSPSSDGRALATLRRLEGLGGSRRPIALVSSSTSLEPSVFGILRPVLVWPERIGERLADEQMEAILAHEVAHVRRRDNLAAAVHMVAEAVFWFHPLVWWVGARLVDERERACDEEVIRLGSEPQAYAEGILRTCEFCVESPLACVAGVTGSDLSRRIERIMVHPLGHRLDLKKKLLLWGAGMAVLTLGIAFSFASRSDAGVQPPPTSLPAQSVRLVPKTPTGQLSLSLHNAPLRDALRFLEPAGIAFQIASDVGDPARVNIEIERASLEDALSRILHSVNLTYRVVDPTTVLVITEPAPAGDAGHAAFEVASVKPNRSGERRAQIRMNPGGRLTVTNDTLRNLIRNAYGLQNVQIAGGPGWIDHDRFDIVAKADGNASRDQVMAMIRALLAERFGLQVHHERRELAVYALVLARDDRSFGPQFKRASEADCVDPRSAPPAPAPGAAGPFPCGGVRFGPGRLTARQVPLPQLAAGFSPWVDRVVIDRTGLSGDFDLDLQWTPDQLPSGPPPPGAPPLPSIDPNGPSIFTAVQEQLGLKLESQKSPVDILVIDSAERPASD